MSTGPPDVTVLVVDDDGALRLLFRQALKQAGIGAVEASSGDEALAVLAAHQVSVVLLDNQMPGTSGLEVLRAIRARAETATLPVVLVTGETEVADRIRGLEAGANDYLTKPVDLDELVARVRSQLRVKVAWLEVLEASLAKRAAAAEALSRVRPGSTPEETASVICAELSRLWDLGGAALFAFTGTAVIVPLAACGSLRGLFAVGRPLSSALADELRSRARAGPWIAERQPLAAADTGTHAHPGGRGQATAFAPLGSPERRLGLLAMSVGRAGGAGPGGDVAQSLSAAIDLAGIITALLGPALEERAEVHSSVAGFEEILRSRAFFPVFQPVIDLRDRRAVGFEALTRFADGSRPDVRLAEAGRVGMVRRLEAAMLEAAFEAADGLPPGCWLSVNVSPGLVLQGDRLGRVLRPDGARPVVLELTEHEPVADYPALLAAFGGLGPGIRLSVDDAGAGYASLRHVLALQPAFVKLDHEWVRGLDADPARQALVAGLAVFASRTGCQLIAEGIETEAERSSVRALGIDLGQGYLLGRPAPVTAGGRGGR